MLAADSFESSSECSEWTESKASPSLYSTSADEVSVMSAKSGALQELFSSLRIDQTSLDDEQPFTSERQVFDDEFDRLFAISDAPENIALDGEGKIVAATIGKLVERLTIGADTEFMEDFLISYRTFMSAQTLARMLSFRLKQGFLSIDDGKLGQSLKLREWLRTYYEVDFCAEEVKSPILEAIEAIRSSKIPLTLADQQIIIKLRHLVLADSKVVGEADRTVLRDELPYCPKEEPSNSISGSSGGTGNSKRQWLKRLRAQIMLAFSSSSDGSERAPSSLCPSVSEDSASLVLQEAVARYEKKSCLAVESSEVMAQQLCLIESDIFNEISWHSLLHYPKSSDQLQRSIDHFNNMCEWFVSEIVHALSHQAQAQITSKLLRICLKSLGYQNYSSVVQIMLALQNPIIEGMESMWRRLSECERELFDDLVIFVSPLRNFRNIRRAIELQEVSNVPCVPFTGLYLSDLANNSERPISGKGFDDLIPWFKCQVTARIVRQFRSFQAAERRYSFPTRPDLYHFILDCCSQVQQDY